ncbi:MAG TPA: neutral zinc metallopeptidase [Arenibaculum sp.]|nr:neutral zinc metallopeptidase [Arenibaculum sp.]
MRWKRGRRSSNVEDRRGMRAPVNMRLPRGAGLRIPMNGRRAGAGGIGMVVVVLILAFVFGIDPGTLFQTGPTGGTYTQAPATQAPADPARSAREDELAAFVSVVLADTEDTWAELFEGFGSTYQEPTVVLFTDVVESACGLARSAVGPFYCPLDRQVYIDLGFYRDLRERYDAPGDFAQAYVLAHEVGHHVQTLLGISERVRETRSTLPEAQANALSVRQELQADCFAGVWGHHAGQRGLLEAGDVEEALNAASAIGDDRLQMQGRGYVAPDTFTHGTSTQRARWFREGLASGDPETCDTFGAAEL